MADAPADTQTTEGRSGSVISLADEKGRRDLADKTTHLSLAKAKLRAKRRRDPWLSIFQEVYDYVFPYRDGFYSEQTEGMRKTNFIYDQTAVVATPRVASRIQHGLFPPQADAFMFLPGTGLVHRAHGFLARLVGRHPGARAA